MKFRKIYWVTENIGANGSWNVLGVYTSIGDLIERGISVAEGDRSSPMRLTLVKLDSESAPLGVWSSPGFGTLAADLEEYVGTGEFTHSECESLVARLASP